MIDTDPGVDDAVAILLALASPELEVVAITSVNGNVGLEATTLNARRLLSLAGRHDVPVAAGCAEPLAGPMDHAARVHGDDGLGDLTWDEPDVPLDPRDAIEVLAEAIEAGPLTIVAIGPLTNLATLLARHPGIDEKLERLVIMGGASFEGNVTAAAEFNVWADPEAAKAVFEARWPITLMPLDLTHQAYLLDEDLEWLRGLGTEVGRRVADMLEPYARFHDEWYGNRNVIQHDATAVYELLAPEHLVTQGVKVTVETGGEYSRGATWIDRRRQFADSPVKVGVSIDNDAFRALIRERLATYRAPAKN